MHDVIGDVEHVIGLLERIRLRNRPRDDGSRRLVDVADWQDADEALHFQQRVRHAVTDTVTGAMSNGVTDA